MHINQISVWAVAKPGQNLLCLFTKETGFDINTLNPANAGRFQLFAFWRVYEMSSTKSFLINSCNTIGLMDIP